MNVNQILSVLWHQKVVLLATIAAFVGIGIGSLYVIPREYESTSTLALSPKSGSLTNLVFFQTINAIVPIYAAATETDETKSIARGELGGKLAAISVRTYTGAPIFKIVARGRDKPLVYHSAEAVTHALVGRVSAGDVGVPSLKLQVIDRAAYPGAAVFPRRNLTIAVAALVGLAAAVALALLRESITNKVRTREDLAEAVGVPVYAEVPLEGALGRRATAEKLLNSELHGVTEALRDLRTNLLFPAGRVSSVVVTSPEGRHGKTTVSVGLAVAMARAGARTLLVDADLRRGRIAKLLDLEPAPGLRDVLEGASPDSAVQGSSLRELDVLTAGRLLADPGELLAAHFPDLLRQLERHYDTVVVDTTPLVPVGDARLVASVASATIIVVSSGAVSRGAVRRVVERLGLIAVTPTGAVLNKSRTRQARGYYGQPSGEDGSTAEQVSERI